MTTRMTEAGPQTPMMSLSWVNLAVVVIVGIFSLLFLRRAMRARRLVLPRIQPV